MRYTQNRDAVTEEDSLSANRHSYLRIGFISIHRILCGVVVNRSAWQAIGHWFDPQRRFLILKYLIQNLQQKYI